MLIYILVRQVHFIFKCSLSFCVLLRHVIFNFGFTKELEGILCLISWTFSLNIILQIVLVS